MQNNMRTNNLKLSIYIMIIMVLQILLNTSTKLYLDLMGVVIVILLLHNNYSFRYLIIITLLADVIGHWYLGTHLFAAVLITFLSGHMTNFFNLSTFPKKSVIVSFFYTIFSLIILLVDLCLHNPGTRIIDMVVEIFILVPIGLKILDKLLVKHNEDVVF